MQTATLAIFGVYDESAYWVPHWNKFNANTTTPQLASLGRASVSHLIECRMSSARHVCPVKAIENTSFASNLLTSRPIGQWTMIPMVFVAVSSKIIIQFAWIQISRTSSLLRCHRRRCRRQVQIRYVSSHVHCSHSSAIFFFSFFHFTFMIYASAIRELLAQVIFAFILFRWSKYL